MSLTLLLKLQPFDGQLSQFVARLQINYVVVYMYFYRIFKMSFYYFVFLLFVYWRLSK